MSDVLALEGIGKRFPRSEGFREALTFWRRPYIQALSDVTFNVPKGRTLGIVGPNGAGKTTLLKILAGLILPDGGRIEFGGIDVTDHPEHIRERLMYVYGEERSLSWRLTARQNLKFWAALFDVPHKQVDSTVEEVLDIVGLTDVADERVMKYSTGMKHRVVIARGLLGNPEILLLDEPTRSLDPVTARKLWVFIKDILIEKRGTTVLVATHNMEEVAYLCTDVAVLQAGTVRAFAPVKDMARFFDEGGHRCVISVDPVPEEVVARLRSTAGILKVSVVPPNGHATGSLDMLVGDPDVNIPPVVEQLVAAGSRVSQVTLRQASLGDIIVRLTEEPAK